jgi:hypothetical protein
LWAEILNAKDISKEMFPVYGGKCLSRKAVHSGGRRFADDEDVKTLMRKWPKQSKDFCAAGFDALVKRCDKYIIVGGEYFEK